MKQLGLGIIVAFGLTFPAFADPPSEQALKGEYGFTDSGFCIINLAGFNAAFESLGPGSIGNSVQSGTYVFNADGTGTVTTDTMSITFSNTFANGGASQGNKTTFHYTVADDMLTIIGGGTASGTIIAGPRAGQTFVVTNLSTLTGWISRGHRTLTLTSLTPVVQTITYSGAPTGPYSRVCGTQRVLTPLP